MKKFIIVLISLNLLLSCNDDDDDEKSFVIEITTEDFESSINENPSPDQEIGYILGSSNNGDVIFEIQSQTPQGALSIDNESGLLTVVDPTKFDFELNTIITGIVRVSNDDVFMDTNIIININDIEDSMLTVENFDLQMDENPQADQILGSILATTDQGILSYVIENQEPEGAFQIDESTGELSIADISLFDFELNESVTGIIKVSNEAIVMYSNVTINLNDIEDSVITVENFDLQMDENPQPDEILGSISASTDQGTLSYVIENQEPEGAFQIDENTGELSIADFSLFDFELNETITGTINVSNQSIEAFALVTITLNDVFDPDIIVSASDFEITINEGPTSQEILGYVEATTNEGSLTYTILEQYPENAFSIDENTGELKVEQTGLFNYETDPVVSGIVEVANGGVSATAAITINLLDIQENDLLLSTINSTLSNEFNPYYSGHEYGDRNHTLSYLNGKIQTWHNSNYSFGEEWTFTSSNNLITHMVQWTHEQGNVCVYEYDITYDSSDRIMNIEFACDEYYDSSHYNYNMEYNGNTINFIDQDGSNDKSIVLNSNNQIINYTYNSDSIDYMYEGENLISLTGNNLNITIEYDNYNNPFKLDETLNLAQIYEFIDVMRGQDFQPYSKRFNHLRNTNNIVKIINPNWNTNEVNYYYNYNSDDYPISKTLDVVEGSVEFFYN